MKIPKLFKTTYLYTVLLVNLVVHTGSAQISNFDEILSSKDYATLTKHLADELDLCIIDDTQINTKTEAIERIRQFLNAVDIKMIDNLHSNKKSGAGSTYSVYKLTTQEKQLRVFLFYEKIDGKDQITELRIDKF